MLKEGLYEDREQRDELLALARFRSTARDGLVSLDDYVAAMRPGQEAIYTITGDNLDVIKKSPQLEGFRARGVEVLLLTDPIDEFWVPAIGTYKEKPFKSATRGGVDLDKIAPPRTRRGRRPEPPAKLASLIAIFKLALGDAVKDVRSSERLTDSAVCLVADEGDMDMHLERLLKQHRQLDTACQAHPRAQPAPPADRAARRDRSARPAPPTSCRNSPGCCWTRRASSKASSCPTRPPSPAASPCCSSAVCRKRHREELFGKGRGRSLGDRDLEGVQRVADKCVVADDRDHLGQAGFAQYRHRFVEARVGEAPRFEQLGADAINERFVLLIEARRLAAADGFDRRSRDPGFLGERRVRVPLVLRAPELGRGDDRKLGKAVRQRGSPAQMLTELCRVLTNLGSADQ